MKITLLFNQSTCRCTYCSNKIKDKVDFTLDHVFPLSKGGEHTEENIVVSCRECNLNKADMLLTEFIKEFDIPLTRELARFL